MRINKDNRTTVKHKIQDLLNSLVTNIGLVFLKEKINIYARDHPEDKKIK
jgi:hypothetical protein